LTRPPDSDTEDPAPLEDDDLFQRRERGTTDRNRTRPRVVPDFVRRAIENTMGSVQNTGVISKDVIGYLLQQGDKGRREITRVVAKEVGDFLRQTDVSSEVVKILTNLQVDVTASVRFRPTAEKGGVRPEMAGDTTVRLVDSDGRDLLHEEPEPTDSEAHRTADLEVPGDDKGGS
jgi:hypothetical protein